METGNETAPEILEKELTLLNSRPLFDIELSSKCNISCKFCPRDKMKMLGTGLMNQKTMNAVVKWLPDNSSVILSGLGEPLLNPNLSNFIRDLRKREFDVSMITNGILLSPDCFNELCDADICEIQISAQTLRKEHYQSEITGSDFDILEKNLSHICKTDRGNVRIRFNSILELDKKEKEDIISFCENNGITPFIRKKHSRGGMVSFETVDRPGCGIFPSTHFISYKGEVMRCVNDRFGNPVGNIFRDSFQTIRDEKRRKILAREYGGACKHCSDDYRWEIMESMDVHAIKKTRSRDNVLSSRIPNERRFEILPNEKR